MDGLRKGGPVELWSWGYVRLSLQIKHRVPEPRPRNTIPPHRLRLLTHGLIILGPFLPLDVLSLAFLGCICAVLVSVQQLVQVAPSALTCHVRPVCRGDEADGLGRTLKHVTQIVRHPLEVVRREPVFVVHDKIVCRSRGALEAAVRYRMQWPVSAVIENPSKKWNGPWRKKSNSYAGVTPRSTTVPGSGFPLDVASSCLVGQKRVPCLLPQTTMLSLGSYPPKCLKALFISLSSYLRTCTN